MTDAPAIASIKLGIIEGFPRFTVFSCRRPIGQAVVIGVDKRGKSVDPSIYRIPTLLQSLHRLE
jgi:hypothetical protein